ncbi:VanZ family protein [Clostridium botulinum]|uniref:VanZ family protein n=1 Tax=Clostridium botulinum TaxID=1491 RepID=A0A6B4JQ39_CLOBO|nr:VanZ family protein [Clostridium botulinum]EES48533.1 acetobutylicum phosphotransbutyrylase [Clostridium botulinum E1 str. 'BoNT E Beluga']MBY6759331.1 VanZ family protein [Clostridium botulinum]MBY6918239.1 VanZ family protein [Clostridium botulinum]MCR1129324.1 VanZ family protein [Clostridium botulinum]NFE94781.1 VanZ family protein [Clostridium botulinum]
MKEIKSTFDKRKAINWILLILWMIIIFAMSNQPAVVSDKQSGLVITTLTNLGIDMNGIFGELANFIVRKTAHFLEYMILGILILNVLEIHYTRQKIRLLGVLLVFLYASSDEIHQLFVQGREGAFRDVVIDTLGGTFGIFVISKLKVLRLKK